MENRRVLSDRTYINIVCDILDNEEFSKIKKINHHGLTRYGHSLRVSYCSYKISKFLRLDYKEVARAGLLHDFFLDENKHVAINKRVITLFNHPKIALKNAKKHFDINKKEEDIILSHMFPISIRTPKYLESWIVDITDNVIAVYEKIYSIRNKILLLSNFLFFFIINIYPFK